MTPQDFIEARYGMFIHFGLYSLLGRGEWVMNREEISPEAMREVAREFNPTEFNAEAIADLAVAAGMKYIVFTTMHHDGFRLYDTALTDFSSVKICGRDLTAEVIAAARSRGLRIGLYHSLNNWHDQPDAVAALEDPAAYEQFMANTHRRIEELVTRYQPIDILWYDGWWPFNANQWQGEKMNAMARAIQPHLLFNGRNGLPGDFATPEQHLSAPNPWRPWEGCMTLNQNWGFHHGDHDWKSPLEIIRSLVRCAQGRGNLLLNIGPDGSGRVPEESVNILREVGRWLEKNRECLEATDLWTIDAYERGDHRADWSSHGLFTIREHLLYMIGTALPPNRLTLSGLEMEVKRVEVLGYGDLSFEQCGGRLHVELPESLGVIYPPVLKFHCDRPPVIYKSGGMRTPRVPHPRYDPLPSDIAW